MPRGRIRKTVDPVTSLSNRLVRVYKNIVLNIIPTLYEGYIVSVHRVVMENRPVDPGSMQGSHRPVSFIRIKQNTRE